jgi:hypothetical protein
MHCKKFHAGKSGSEGRDFHNCRSAIRGEESNMLWRPERQDGFRVDSDVLPCQAANRQLSYLPQAALRLPAVMKIMAFGRAVLPAHGALDALH